MRWKTFAPAAAGLALGGTLLVGPSAGADPSGVRMDSVTWKRSCGTTYKGWMANNYARTVKAGGGTCQGDAWVRVYWAGGWSSWEHHARDIEVRLPGVARSQHKGCADCKVYTLP
ncbi:hypothetical protein [Streptomyces caatingaensis]|uniref:Uncharacterized protein n=1 Tax=Streptomyces caatingaensis TaxID=1678637 RepID=A0A0K9XB11_9ACTN|nr:hypothetical protein [Streptomyces caatingaensis]KNB50599.1 hypothetical protein AC230_21955 [Streptomyces caatingaensis]